MVIMMMTEMFLIAGVESNVNMQPPPTSAALSNEPTTAPDSGGKELRAYVNLMPLLCPVSECVCEGGGKGGGGPYADILDL